MKPGDYIILPTADHITYLWCVIGVYHGGIGQESLVGLVPAINTPGYANGATREEMFVPWALVCDHVYQRVVGTINHGGRIYTYDHHQPNRSPDEAGA